MKMKRMILLAVAVLSLLALGACQQKKESAKPTWGSAALKSVELGDNMEGKVTVSVPAGVASFTVTLTELPVELVGLVNRCIGVTANRASSSKAGVLDLVEDSALASSEIARFFTPVGAKMSGATSVTLDLGGCLMYLMSGNDLPTGTRFVLDLSLTDKEGNTATQQEILRWTQAPYYQVTGSNPCELTTTVGTLSVDLMAPGKLKVLTMSFGGDKASAFILNYVKNRNEQNTTVDLLGAAAENFGFSASAKATSVKLDFTALVKSWSFDVEANTTTVVTLHAEDALGKSGDLELKLVKN